MVEDTISDGKRIAQLLASELEGLDVGGLDRISVIDANPEATPDESGTVAYRVSKDSERIATVTMYPDRATVRLLGEAEWSRPDSVGHDGGSSSSISQSGDRTRPDESLLVIHTGAAVKGAVDAFRMMPASSAENG